MQLSAVLINLALVLPFAAHAFAAPLTVTIPVSRFPSRPALTTQTIIQQQDTQDVDGLLGPLGAENIFRRQDLSLDGVNVPADVSASILSWLSVS